MKSEISSSSFEKYFELFTDLVEVKSKTRFISFSANRYTENEEGYKDKIYEETRKNLQFWEWKKEDIGTGKIVKKVIAAIEIKNNNLVKWQAQYGKEQRPQNCLYVALEKHDGALKKYEKAFFDFFLSLETDQKSFDVFIECFGKKYPLIAYFFFIKDKSQYMPISPNFFDVAFDKLGVKDFKTSHQCSWDNYIQYNNLLNQVRELLTDREIKGVSLLNAHSFVWIIFDIEKQLNEIGLASNEKKIVVGSIGKYQILGSKDRDAEIKVRIGQGPFRKLLARYWNKCSVTGCRKINILTASHIKPWKDCDNEEAVDVYNGLLLIPNMDKLFDRGLISFSNKGEIIISPQLTNEDLIILGVQVSMKLNKIENNHFKYLDYHRKKIFKK